MEAIDVKKLSNDEVLELFQIMTSNQPNKENLQKAQFLIEKYKNEPESLDGCLFILSNNKDWKILQFSAIILYKSIDHNWSKISDAKKEEIKKLVLQLYSKEKNYIVLKNIGYAIFKICKKTLSENKWDNLLELIFSSPDKYGQGEAHLFEINLYIIANLVGSLPILLQDKNKLNQIKNILSTAFIKGNNKMKENATECLGHLIRNMDMEYLSFFKDLSDYLFKDLKNCDEKVILKVYETLCESNIEILNFFKDLQFPIKLTIELLNNENYKGNLKAIMAEFLYMIAQHKKKLFTQNNCELCKSLLNTSLNLIKSDENEDDNMEENTTSLFNIGLNIINFLCNTISSKKTFPFLIEIIKNYIQSKKWLERVGAIAIIGVMAEGCAVPMKDNIEDIINLLINTFTNDQSEKVKGQCIVSMDFLTQFCSPEINEYYDKVIPMLLEGLFSKNEDIVEKSLMEINYFFSSIDLEMEDYLNMNSELNIKLLQKLIEILHYAKNGSIQEKSLTALGAVVTNGHNLNPDTLIPILTSLQNITKTKNSENDQKLIGSTLDCVGNILVVIKKEKYIKELEDYFNKFAYECIKSPVYDLQLGGLSYFSALAEIKGDEFNNLLPGIMEYTEKIIKDESGIIEKAKEKDEIGLDSDSEEVMDGNDEMYWNQDFMNVKSLSIKCLAVFAKSCPKLYIEKYFQFTLDQLEYFSNYCNEEVFYAVVDVYEALLFSIESSGDKTKDINDFWVKEVLTHYESFINETDDQELVSHIFGNIFNIVDHFGKNIFKDNKTNNLNTSLDRIINLTLKLLKNELPCQIRNKEAEEGEMEHEEDIFDSIKSVCLCLSEKLQDDFHNYFNIIYPQLSSYLKPTYDEEDRQNAFGIIAEVLKHTKISVKFYAKQLFEDIQKNLSGKKKNKKSEDLYRHISYLIGVLFISDPQTCKDYINQGLQNLQLIFEKSKKEGKDNVIAALCRIIMAYQYNKTNFNLFDKSVETIMTNLPLKYDNNENLTVLDFLIYIIEILDLEQYKKYIGSIMKVLHCIVIFDAKCETKPEHLEKVKQYINKLNQNETIKILIEDIIKKDFTPAEKEKFIKSLN